MKRSWPSIFVGTVLAAILILYMITFQVRYSEVGVVRTFGEIREGGIIKEPGLYWKWPWPIQKVDTFDRRIQTTSTVGEETPTGDGKNVIVTTTICWRIDEPRKFSIRCRDMADADNKIQSRVRNDQKTVISNYNFSHFVSTNPEELKYDQIEPEIGRMVRANTEELYGVKIERVAIEALALPQRVTESVIEAMKKERQATAQEYTSQGESQAKQIRDTADSIAGTIMAFADRKAEEIRAEGRQRAIRYNETFRQDEDLAMFLLRIENIPRILGERATLILDEPTFTELLSESAGKGPATRPAGAGKSAAAPLVIPALDSR
ncbi:MAG TPA: SPFH domain-containing protein [Phycisphaerae bacterium]|nr:SPFH domain-containing protein [Phycisphaerae bacterium]